MLIPSLPTEVDDFMDSSVASSVSKSTGRTLNELVVTRGNLVFTDLVAGGTLLDVVGPMLT